MLCQLSRTPEMVELKVPNHDSLSSLTYVLLLFAEPLRQEFNDCRWPDRACHPKAPPDDASNGAATAFFAGCFFVGEAFFAGVFFVFKFQ